MFEFIAISLCVLFNAFLAASETAFIATNKATLKVLAKKENSKASLLLKIREHPERFLSTIQIGITFFGAFAAAIGGAGAQEGISPILLKYLPIDPRIAELISALIVVIPFTYFSVVIGELVPKTLALRTPFKIATETAPRLHKISKAIFPIVRLLEWSTKKVISYFPSSTGGGKEGEEGDLVIDNTLTPLNRQYILNMVKIDQTKVKDIFHEWEHVDFIHESSSIEELEKMLITSGHTRLPVEKDGEVIGVLNSKEFFAFQKTGQTTWLNLVRKPVKMQTNTLILNALKVLQSGGTAHMAIVYRGEELAGIVTMEDIFEEIVGDIYDEDDHGSIENILSRTKY